MSRTTLVQDIADQVTCGICLEHFKIPKTVMPCLHNFCECCLQDMIESTAHPIGRASADLTVYATFSFPCPSCRGAVEFPVRIPQPWVMKRIAHEAVEKEFKTNFQIKNQLDIINTKIKQGCQEHQGEIKMWFCKACKVIICQFCVLQDHNSSEHEITLLNLEQKKQGLKHSKQQVQKQVAELESSCADMEGQLADIHKTKGRFEDQKKLIMDEFVAVHIKLETMESQLYSKQQNFIQQLTSSEMQILQVYQEASEDVEHYKTKVDELDRKIADADFGIGSLSDETESDTSLKPMSIPVVEIPKPPEISLDLLQDGMLEINEMLTSISHDLGLSDIEPEPDWLCRNDQPVNTTRISGHPSLTTPSGARPTQIFPSSPLLQSMVIPDPKCMNFNEFQQLQAPRAPTNLPYPRSMPPVRMQVPQTQQQYQPQMFPYQPTQRMPGMAPSFIPGPSPGLLPPTSQYVGSPQPPMRMPQLNMYDSRQQQQLQYPGLLQQPHNMAPIYQPFASQPVVGQQPVARQAVAGQQTVPRHPTAGHSAISRSPLVPTVSTPFSIPSSIRGVSSTQQQSQVVSVAPVTVTASHRPDRRPVASGLISASLQPGLQASPSPPRENLSSALQSVGAFQSFYQQQPTVSAKSSPRKTRTRAQQLPPPTHPTSSTLPSEQPKTADVTNSASNTRYPWEEDSSTADVAETVSGSLFPWEESYNASTTDSSSRSDSTEASAGLNESSASSTDTTPTFKSFSSVSSSPLRDETQSADSPVTADMTSSTENAHLSESVSVAAVDDVTGEENTETTAVEDIIDEAALEETNRDGSSGENDEDTIAGIREVGLEETSLDDARKERSDDVPQLALGVELANDNAEHVMENVTHDPTSKKGDNVMPTDGSARRKRRGNKSTASLQGAHAIQLKYTYKKDQWSPCNPAGKRHYGRDFLMQFQTECTYRPKDLPSIPGVVLDQADIHLISAVEAPQIKVVSGGNTRKSIGLIDYMPEYLKPTTRRVVNDDDGIQLRPNGRTSTFGAIGRGASGGGACGIKTDFPDSQGATFIASDFPDLTNSMEEEKSLGGPAAIKSPIGDASTTSKLRQQCNQGSNQGPLTAHVLEQVADYGRVDQRSEQFIFQEPLTARMLAKASQNEQKQMLGERLYPIIHQMHGDLSGKITGMLLEINNAELLHMLQSSDALHSKVEEAVAVLQVYQSKKTSPVKTYAQKLRNESQSSGQSDDETLAIMARLLGSMFAKKNCSNNGRNNKIRDWIEKNIDVQLRRQNIFIRALVAIVCRSSMKDQSNRCDPDLLKSRARLLPRYIDGDFTKELQALFAVQELNHKLNNPPGFLRLIFDVFYDEDLLISEEAFFVWRENDDPNEQIGKDEALASAEDFFMWLNEGEDSD